ncbi:hypothetical protein TIFTF001_025620 [Ficus carica]|uniref:Ubiquitin-like domain-containing protein n=1 Tax=Ficus carica TaxID=3494 RepID=A0AA88DGQ7_FICCA|nr:hypothetical protein TIFTF001_025620 [Ficus carica]
MKLIYAGKQLADDKTAKDYNIEGVVDVVVDVDVMFCQHSSPGFGPPKEWTE